MKTKVYFPERGDRSYLAPVGALSLNFNVVAIHVAPGGRAGEKGRQHGTDGCHRQRAEARVHGELPEDRAEP